MDGDRVQPRGAPRDSPARRSSASPTRRTCSARALRASRFATRFAWKPSRTQRQSDGTISLEGVRFEIPARYRHFRELTVRYARWNLGRVDLVDRRSGIILAPLYPLDKTANADGRRAPVAPAGQRRAAGEQARQRRRAAAAFEADPPGVFRHGTAAGVPPQDTTFPAPETPHEYQETARAVGAEMEPVFTRAPQRGTAGDPQDRALRLAGRTVGPGGRLRADLGGVGDRQECGAADRRRPACGAAGRHRRCDRAAPVQELRLLSRAGRHLLGEAHAAEPLGRIQGAPRALESPCGLVADQAGAVDRRSPGDDPRGPGRAADPLQCRLRCHCRC